ncbi:DNA-binding protein [Methylobacterium sp. Leaf123]|jgi:transcriptional regulator with XRE-family HTH domain|uniref:helix-turn-helix domain-containing protein n=1 Tax=Methylobacterium sp. Leaf123 TaxID=1736264 RepID=UPI0006F63719|nr:helix-turn-helix transcriptional regulator [Methylobacterium sp. Leaf123]KQO91135.1 DNA-binding protein [Methylobacterium sp. Leaf90]KQQ11800.1 DNA-binding protein [Methylobacterium sp. Leaf123]
MYDHSASPKQAFKEDIIVGLRIQTLRKSRGFSQTALGIAIGVSFRQIQKYENGANRVGADRLSDIARVLGASVSTFFEEGDDTAAQEKTEVSDLLRAPGAVDLLNAFITIEDDRLRREVLALVRSATRMQQDRGA